MAFQTITPTKLGQAAMPTSPTVNTLYTVPAATRTFVKDIDICNTSASTALTANVYLVPSAGSPTTANTLIPGITIPPNGMFQWSGAQILNAGDMIQITSSAAGLTINVSGGEAV